MMHNSNKQAGNAYKIILVVLGLIVFFRLNVPWFFLSSERSQYYRADSDLRTLRTGIESYRVDYDEKFPPNLHRMTTPIAFVQTIPTSPYGEDAEYSYYYEYGDTTDIPSVCLVWCTGPDEKNDLTKSLLSQRIKQERERVGNKISKDSITMLLYDQAYESSNGTKSSGDVFRVLVDTIPSSSTASR